jgi:hypothetical protein
MDAELNAHIEAFAEDLMRSGVAPREAKRRFFEERDNADAPKVAMVNQAFARRFFQTKIRSARR